MTALLCAVLSIIGRFSGAASQSAEPVSQKEIDAAIRRGADFLKTAPSPGGHLQSTCDELILLTFLHAGVSEKTYEPLLGKCLSAPLQYTYKVSLLAMSLEELDATRYQGKLAQCAQFLIDNQAANGQWSYGKPTASATALPFEDKDVASADPKKKRLQEARDFGAQREHRKPKTSISVRQTRTVGESGDNSNSQYAALGLRACFDANIRLPEEVLQKARAGWASSQWADESGAGDVGKNSVSSGASAPSVRGWNYKKKGEAEDVATLPMTAGAVGATVICEYILGRDWKKDPVTRAGVNWIGKHFSIHENYYYLYGLERAGMLYGCEAFEGRNWYEEGARLLLAKQKPGGSWGDRKNQDENTWDTCFAILFLKKATRAIATEGGGGRK